jgi:hypothetical protein
MSRSRRGQTLGLGPPEGEQWIWMTRNMFASISYRALGIHARRILDFLLNEHTLHGGRDNGNLVAPYKQLGAWGVTAADVRKGLAELYATGFVEQTYCGERRGGISEASRYALTWLPTRAGTDLGMPPSHKWVKVLKAFENQQVGSVAAARRWLATEVAPVTEGTRRKRASHLQVVPPITCEVRKAG